MFEMRGQLKQEWILNECADVCNTPSEEEIESSSPPTSMKEFSISISQLYSSLHIYAYTRVYISDITYEHHKPASMFNAREEIDTGWYST